MFEQRRCLSVHVLTSSVDEEAALIPLVLNGLAQEHAGLRVEAAGEAVHGKVIVGQHQLGVSLFPQLLASFLPLTQSVLSHRLAQLNGRDKVLDGRSEVFQSSPQSPSGGGMTVNTKAFHLQYTLCAKLLVVFPYI